MNDTPGVIYRISTNGENYTVLHTFKPGQGGQGGLIQASNGLLYGTAVYGYPYSPCPGVGSFVFSMTVQGQVKPLNAWTGCPGPGPNGPQTGLVEASDGNLYGTTVSGGGFSAGTIWRIGLDGQNYESIVNFGYSLGVGPGGRGGAGLIQGSDGWLYGTAATGGDFQQGTVFRLSMNLPPPLPAISYFGPFSGKPGSTVLIAGQHLVGIAGVSFNGVPATTVISRGNNYVVTIVPPGATTGPVTVTTMNGSATSKHNFTVE